MAKNDRPVASDFENAVAAFAASERQRLGSPPTDEQLQALREGRLDEAEADRLHAFLAANPDWADAYLDMGREENEALQSDLAAEAEASGVDIDAAWQQLETRLPPAAGHPAPAPHWRFRAARILPMAAALFLTVGLVWMVFTSGPSADVLTLRLETSARGSDLEVPRSAGDLELVVDTRGLQLDSGRYTVTLRDSTDQVLAVRELEFGPDQPTLRLRVRRSRLRENVTNRVEARRLGAPAEEVRILAVFVPVFVDS